MPVHGQSKIVNLGEIGLYQIHQLLSNKHVEIKHLCAFNFFIYFVLTFFQTWLSVHESDKVELMCFFMPGI